MPANPAIRILLWDAPYENLDRRGGDTWRAAILGKRSSGRSVSRVGASDDLAKKRNVVVTSHKRDGSAVATAVNVVVIGDRSKVTVPPISATARLRGPNEVPAVREALCRNYPIPQARLGPLAHRLRHYDTVHYELSASEPASPSNWGWRITPRAWRYGFDAAIFGHTFAGTFWAYLRCSPLPTRTSADPSIGALKSRACLVLWVRVMAQFGDCESLSDRGPGSRDPAAVRLGGGEARIRRRARTVSCRRGRPWRGLRQGPPRPDPGQPRLCGSRLRRR